MPTIPPTRPTSTTSASNSRATAAEHREGDRVVDEEESDQQRHHAENAYVQAERACHPLDLGIALLGALDGQLRRQKREDRSSNLLHGPGRVRDEVDAIEAA